MFFETKVKLRAERDSLDQQNTILQHMIWDLKDELHGKERQIAELENTIAEMRAVEDTQNSSYERHRRIKYINAKEKEA